MFASLRAVLYGVVAGFLTPNRMGEPFGRVAMLKPESRLSAGLLAFWASSSQIISTLLFGTFGWIWLSSSGMLLSSVGISITILCWVLVGVAIAALAAFIWLERIARVAYWIPWLKVWFERYGTVGLSIPTARKRIVLYLSFLRHVVFTFQLMLVLRIFRVDVAPLDLFAAISVTYLLATLVPTLTIGEPAVRAAVGVLIVGMLSENHVGIMLSFFSLWLINVAVPALVVVWMPKGAEQKKPVLPRI